MDIGLYGFVNPAVLSYVRSFDTMTAFSNLADDEYTFDRFGFFLAFPGLGFGVMNRLGLNDDWKATYRISSSFGNTAFSVGFGYEWTEDASGIFDADNLYVMGLLARPFPFLSLGLSGSTSFSGEHYEAVFETGIRPFRADFLTLFADYALQDSRDFDELLDGTSSIGLVARFPFIEGLYCSGRFYPKTLDFSIGLKISSGYSSLAVVPHFSSGMGMTRFTYTMRAGAAEPGLIDTLVTGGGNYVKLELNGTLEYQGVSFFRKRNTLLSLLKQIDNAGKDPSVAGIAVNTSGLQADAEMLWEIRRMLEDFKASGKHVVIYLDNGGVNLYHLATVADRVVIDPLGGIMLQGYLAGFSFYKGSLEKLGIGFEEIRLYTYKSALESLSRESMSDANREQYDRYIGDIYDYVKKEICDARGIAEDEFDTLVDTVIRFNAETAISHNLADAAGRWDAIEEEIEKLEGRKTALIPPEAMMSLKGPYDKNWGVPKTIAVVYALGVCAMDTGIKARSLEKVIDAAGEDPVIRAIVVRVDSPGGDPLASDLVAEAIERCKKKKPVVISQGLVAGSGGYWLSMNGDAICTAPQTLTGSIGAIGGWMYDNGLKEKLGITTDFVKRGDHADLGFGFALPYLMLGLPDRNLDQDERRMLEDTIAYIYKQFVSKVASGRNKEEDEIEKIAQGRIWSGLAAKEVGLADEIGGLWKAIAIAKEMAGIPEKERVEIVELPAVDFMSVYAPFLSLLGITVNEKADGMVDAGSVLPEAAAPFGPLFEYLRFRLDNNGKAMPILDFEMMDVLLGERNF